MSDSVLVAYATRYGSTQEVAEAIGETLREEGLGVEVQPMQDVRTLAGYDAVVLGAALYMYRWHKDARRFLTRHRKALDALPVAIFALGPVKDPRDEEEWRNSRDQLESELEKHSWLEPVAVEILGGKFDPKLLRFPLNLFAGSEPASDIRDWEAISTWAGDVASKLGEA